MKTLSRRRESGVGNNAYREHLHTTQGQRGWKHPPTEDISQKRKRGWKQRLQGTSPHNAAKAGLETTPTGLLTKEEAGLETPPTKEDISQERNEA